MKNEFVPQDIAKEMKKLGFDEGCFAFYRDGDYPQAVDQHWGSGVCTISEKDGFRIDDLTLAPLYQQAFRWFYEEHKIESAVMHDMAFHDLFSGVADKDACLRKLIEMVKNKE